MAGPAGADHGCDVVGADAGGDVGLGAGDDVVGTIADRFGCHRRHIGTRARLGDRQRSDLVARERRTDVFSDLFGIAGGGDVRGGDRVGEQ